MSFVEFLLICGTIALHSLQISASIPAPKPGQASLVIIFDTTGSMHDDLEELRKGAAFIVRKMMTEEKNPIYNYIFVPFNDPHFGPIFVTRNPQELLRKLDGVTVDGGGDCPEMSISGIKMALTECLPDSFVYVFTDADEKDSHLVPDVLTLIQKKRISITFIAAEGCDSTFKTYYSIAKKSNGQVYKIKSRDTNTILEHIGDTLDEGLQTLKVAYFEGAGAHEFGVDVDKSVKDFSVSVSGSDPNITVRNPEDEISEKAKTVIDLPRVKTVKVKDPEPGRWVVDASSTSGHSVKIAGVSDLKFDFGFSLHTPANIDEASPRPFRGYTNKFCVAPSDPAAIEKFTVVRFFKDDPKNEFELILNMELIDKSKMISCVAFSPPPGAFKIEIKGVDSSGYAFSRFLPTALETSDVTKPQYLGESLEQSIEMAPNTSVELNCKMAGKPEPSIEWMQEDKVIPGVSGDVHRIKHDKEKPLRKYSCVGTNTEGSAKVTFHVTSAQPPQLMQELLKHKNDSAIKLLAGETLEINCPVKGVPDPTIKWIKNGIFISDREENINSLTIPSVKEFDEGEYECIAENDYGNIRGKD
ncbi:hemicentin-1-like isoform X2 [Phlebotomus argentipes]|uniref:hemicentin-1-like isoform X2 n=1 Tax=Phlebotomus argentipes TaxID=94469 RepID=UPI002892DDDC|nr:hemicentin-1-like isoform X2 [Phlebotomus argentipes]